MFGLLKKKLSKAIESISKRIERKEEVIKEVRPEIQKESKEVVTQEKPEETIEVEIIPKLEESRSEIIIGKPEPKKKGIFKRFAEKVVKKVTERKLTEDELEPILEDLVTDLMEADVAYETAEEIKRNLMKSLVDKEIKRGAEKETVVNALKESLLKILSVPEIDLNDYVKDKKPVIILFLGFNGSGKTTSLAKTAKWLMNKGFSCVFAAADTFRAAAEEQLEVHAKNLKVNLIKHKYGADPAAVIFDAIEHAKAKNVDFVLADSAGRAHTNANLMAQMEKIVRVNKPDLKVLVIDSLTGNDAVLQARMFGGLGVDATIFTKVDVNEKGGAILSVAHELKKPILFLANGQEYDNLEKFDAGKFVENILE